MTLLEEIAERRKAFHNRIAFLASQREKMRPLPASLAQAPKAPMPPPVPTGPDPSKVMFNPVLRRGSNAAYESAWHKEICGCDFAEPVIGVGPKVKAIKRAVCELFSMREEVLLSKRRQKDLVEARQIAMWLAKMHTTLSLPQIGRTLGDRDHTTILHGINKIDGLLAKDENLRARIALLEVRLGFVRTLA